MKRVVQFKDYPQLTVHLCGWFPLFSQGIYFFGTAFVKFVYYKDTKVISSPDTDDVIKHEYAHFVSRRQRGFFNFWANIIWDYMKFWIKHNDKEMETEANSIKKDL